MNPSPISLPFRVSVVALLVLILLFLVLDTWMVSAYLLTLMMGGILAILTLPLYDRVRRRGLGPKLSAMIVVLATILLVVVPLGVISYLAIQQGIAFSQSLAQSGGPNLDDWMSSLMRWHPLKTWVGNPDQIQAQAQRILRTAAATGSAWLLAALGGLPGKILNMALALLTQFFLLIEGRRFRAWLDDRLPLDPEVRTSLYSSFQDTATSTIWATLAAAAVQGIVMMIAFLVLGVPGAFLAAGATFLFAWIPLVGSTPVWIFGVLYLALSQHSLLRALVMVAFGLVTGVSDNFVRPMVLRGRSDMHPLVSLVAIFGGIESFGILGVFYGPILIAVFLSLLQIWPTIARRLGWMRESERKEAIQGGGPGLRAEPPEPKLSTSRYNRKDGSKTR